jgi:hypothetical protein
VSATLPSGREVAAALAPLGAVVGRGVSPAAFDGRIADGRLRPRNRVGIRGRVPAVRAAVPGAAHGGVGRVVRGSVLAIVGHRNLAEHRSART